MLKSLLIASLACCLLTRGTAGQEYSIGPQFFECYRGSGTVNFSTSRISEIGHGFIDSSSVTCLDLNSNIIEKIAEGAFDSLPNLKQLYLSSNQIVNLQNVFASSIPNLETLDLTDARNKRGYPMELHIAASFPFLHSLFLSNNQISKISVSGPHRFPKLEQLELSKNQLSDTDFMALDPNRLVSLNLSANALQHLTGNFGRLVFLDLSKNKFNGVSYAYPGYSNLTLSGFTKLRVLNLANNFISYISEDAFDDTANLEMLDLSYNQLKTIPTEALSSLKSLKSLILVNNMLKEVPRSQIQLPVNNLNLERNSISIVTDSAFAWAENLMTLRLNYNKIVSISCKAFFNLKKLQVLDLSNNQLSTLPNGWCTDLTDLRYLDLKQNKFTSLESVAMMATVPLDYLFLEGNNLKFLKPSSLSTMSQNVTINLDPNRPYVNIPDIIIQ